MEKFELSIKSTDIKGKAELKIRGSNMSIMNGLSNLVNALKKQEVLEEEDIKIAVKVGLENKANGELGKEFDEIFKHILNL